MKSFAWFLLLLFILGGCHKRTPLTALPAVPTSAAPKDPPPITELPAPPSFPQPDVPATPVLDPLDQADSAFNTGNYPEAARRYEKYMQSELSDKRGDEALYRWALSLALMPAANTDWTRVTTMLKQLVDHYPESPFRAPSTLILSLTADAQKREQRIKQLTTELDKLKQIDADRRRRP